MCASLDPFSYRENKTVVYLNIICTLITIGKKKKTIA